MIRVKICGLNTAEAVDAAVAAGTDWLGFNFFPPSPRFVSVAQAADLAARAVGPQRVGLFVEPVDEDIATMLARVPLDILQIYAAPARAAEIRERFGLPVWRAVAVSSDADLPAASEAVDAYLIEPKPPAGATRPGGNAVSLDWRISAHWVAPLPWLLAGGLTPENVAEAIAASGATAVDVSSGVERVRGVKDPALIAAFIARAKG